MRPISTPTCVNSWLAVLAAAGLLGLVLCTTAGAVTDAVHDPHRMLSNEDFQQTIEARCIICHTRDRIDQAMGEDEDLDALLQRMIERGAVLSERDKKVLGTFWGSPLSGDGQPERLPAQD